MERPRECDVCEQDAEWTKNEEDYCQKHAIEKLDVDEILKKNGFRYL